jgi:putative transposase
MANNSLRHIDGFVKSIVDNGETKEVLRRALEAALAALMEGEVSVITGAGHGEVSESRETHRNGYRERRLDTTLGTIPLRIPRVRTGSYMPSFLSSNQRSDAALVAALVECFQQGVSTRKAEAVARSLGVESMSKSTVSRMLGTLDEQVKAYRERPLPECPYVFVDARYENVREDHAVRKMAVMVALGVRPDGGKEFLGFWVARVENEAYWGDFLADLRRRGLEGVKLMVSDAHEGLRRAIQRVYPGSMWQRCKVHFLRNLAGRLPRKKQPSVMALVKTVFAQDSQDEALVQRTAVAKLLRQMKCGEAADLLEGATEVLTYMQFPKDHWTKLHSTNVVERLNRSLKVRTRVVSIFPNKASVERLIGALLLEEQDEWLDGRRFISAQSMKLLLQPATLQAPTANDKTATLGAALELPAGSSSAQPLPHIPMRDEGSAEATA